MAYALNTADNGLAEEQDRAVHAPLGPTIIVAGPGSGKTTVTISRVAWMIQEMNIDPSEIVVFTFTNRAARELRERLNRSIREQDMEGLFAGTFHSWGARFLQTYGHHCGLEHPFSIYDQDDSLEAIQKAMKETGDSEWADRAGPRRQMRRINRWKSRGQDAEHMIKPWLKSIGSDQMPKQGRRVLTWLTYDEEMRTNNAVDFDDLITLPLRIMEENEDVLQEIHRRVRHILVDEYQDTSRAQHRMVTTMANRSDGGRASLFVVGDSDQAIYGFREADIRNFNGFRPDDYPEARELHLENNYRSSSTIVEAAQELIEKNRKRISHNSKVTRDRGASIRRAECANPDEEAEIITADIDRRLEDARSRADQICVAYRTNPQSRPLEEALRRKGIRYTIAGNSEFFQRLEVKRHIDYLRLALNPADQGALKRVINVPERSIGPRMMRLIEEHAFNREIGIRAAMEELEQTDNRELMPAAREGLKGFRTTMAALTAMISAQENVGQLIKYVSTEAGLADHFAGLKDGAERTPNIRELQRIAEGSGNDMAAFLERTAMRHEGPSRGDTGRVTLATMHQTKGLEFEVVYLAGVEETLVPLGNMEDERGDLEEERRLLYVGMTRAKDELTITWCKQRPSRDGQGNEVVFTGESRFIEEIPSWAWGEALPSGNPQRTESDADAA